MVYLQILFNSWFAENYGKLHSQLCCNDVFGELYDRNCEDCLHNAYLCVYDSLKSYSGETDFNILFRAAYRRQRKAYALHEIREIKPKDLFWAFIVACNSDPLRNERRTVLLEERAKAVKSFVSANFSDEQKKIFRLYFVHSCTYEQIAAYVGKSVPTITKCVKFCKDCLFCKFKDYCMLSDCYTF